LKPGGYAVTWVPTDRVGQTFLRVFEHAAHFGPILIGSNAPIQIDRDAFERRLADPVVQQHFSRAFVRVNDLLREAVAGAKVLGPDPRRLEAADINTDVHPKDEFAVHLMFDRSLLRPEGSR
jgi:hypothetical protein